MEVKDEVKNSFKDQLGDWYTTAKGYKLFLGNLQVCRWSTQVWNRWNVPKHSVILWLAWQNRLTTRERVIRYMTSIESHCIYCSSQVEDINHLFFRCHWTKQCLEHL